jgi:hypothetical protein
MQQVLQHRQPRVDFGLSVLARPLVQVIAALGAKTLTIRATNRLKREVEKEVFPSQGAQIEDACLGNSQERVGRSIRWIDEKIVKRDLQRLIEWDKASDAFQTRFGLELSLTHQPLGGAGEADRATQIPHLEVVTELCANAIKVENAAEADVPMEQKPDVQPQWLADIQIHTATRQHSFQKSVSIIT